MAQKNLTFADESWLEKLSGRFLIYKGDYLQENLNINEVAKFVHKKGAVGALWSYDFNNNLHGPWYRYICDDIDYKIENIRNKKGRYYIRKGLKDCVVKPIDYLWLAENGYEVYLKAVTRYTHFESVSKENYFTQMCDLAPEPGREAMGVFVCGKFVAYATLSIRGSSVLVCGSKFDPDYSKSYPMYALYYMITFNYLNEKGFKKIDNGIKPLQHDTNVGDFLLRIGWRKDYCRIGIYLIWPVSLMLRLIKLCNPLCRILLPAKLFSMVQSLLLAQKISKSTEHR